MIQVIQGVYQMSTNGNSFLIDGDEGISLIDCGIPGSVSKIEKALREIGRKTADIASILVTHGHMDHFGSAAALKEASGARVIASELDAPVLQGEVPAPPPPFLGRFGFLARLLPSPDSVLVDHRLAGLGVTTVEDVTAIETPGHTDGHTSYLLDREGGLMFVGDAAVADRSGNVRRGFMNRSEPVFDSSIRKLAEMEFDQAVFGHSAPIASNASRAFAQFAETFV